MAAGATVSRGLMQLLGAGLRLWMAGLRRRLSLGFGVDLCAERSRTNFFPVRLTVSRQPALPSSSGVSGPPDVSFCGGIVSSMNSPFIN